MITKFYKGRLTILEGLNLPIRLVCTLFDIAARESETDEGKKRLEAEALGDALGG